MAPTTQHDKVRIERRSIPMKTTQKPYDRASFVAEIVREKIQARNNLPTLGGVLESLQKEDPNRRVTVMQRTRIVMVGTAGSILECDRKVDMMAKVKDRRDQVGCYLWI